VLVGITTAAIVLPSVFSQRGAQVPQPLTYDSSALQNLDGVEVAYQQTGTFPIAIADATGIAVGPDGGIFVCGDESMQELSAQGEPLQSFDLDEPATAICVAVPGETFPGNLFVAVKNAIHVFDDTGQRVAVWQDGLDRLSHITSLAVSDDALYAADANEQVVHQFDADGTSLGRIGEPDEDRGIDGFVIPSAFFDVVVGDDGLLRVANPGRRKVETFSADGSLLDSWGKSSSRMEDFFGCCNPAHLALLPDGRIVTSEKGIHRIKVYSPEGRLDAVVATPFELTGKPAALTEARPEHRIDAYDIATDRRGRMLVLDAPNQQVRIFEPKTE